MHYTNMTLEELEEQDRELHLHSDELEESLMYRQKIELYTAMHHKVKQLVRRKLEERSYLNTITERLVFNLIHYGTYLKMADQKVDEAAIPSLETALKYDPSNPIAAYRLGFLSYKRSEFINSAKYFKMAISFDSSERSNKNTKMVLTDRQKLNAQLYLTNSALHIAKESQEHLAKFPADQVEQLPGYKFSSLFETIGANDTYLKNHAFYQRTDKDITTCSKRNCEEVANNNPRDTIVLYFGDAETSLHYNGRGVALSKRPSDLLRYLLTNSSADNPAKARHVKEYFGDLTVDEELRWNTYRQAVRRLREILAQSKIPGIIETVQGGKAYYFNQSLPFIMFYRVDDETE